MFEIFDPVVLSAVTLIVVALVGTVGDVAALVRRCAAVVPAGPRRPTQGAAV